MLVKAEDKARFRGEIMHEDAEVWAAYLIEGEVKGEIAKQSDRRMFASEQEAHAWLVGEADKRGFPNFKPAMRDA